MISPNFTIRKAGLEFTVVAGFAVASILAVGLMIKQPLYTFAALYSIGFMALSWKRPGIALLLIVVACPFQSDVGAGNGFAKFSIAEVNLALTLPVFVAHMIVRRQRPSIGPLALPVLCYLTVCIYSSWASPHGEDTVISIAQMVDYFVIAVAIYASFAYKLSDLRPTLYAFVIVCTLLSITGVITSYSFLGMNKNGIGSSLAAGLLVCVELWLASSNTKEKKLFGVCGSILAVGLLLSLSRGAWLGTVIGLSAIFGLRRRWDSLWNMLIPLVPLLVICWFAMPQESRDYASGLDVDRTNIQARLDSVDFAEADFQRNEVVGVGVGVRKEYDATNVIMLTLAETGILGLIAFLAVQGTFFGMVISTARKMNPSHPYFTFLVVGAALMLSQLGHGMVDHYWSRGALTAAYAAAGMAVGVYLKQRRQQTLVAAA